MSNKKGTTKLQLNRGIRVFNLADRKSPFVVQWRERGKRKTKTFENEKDRDKYAERLSTKAERHGKDILNFDPKEWAKWLQFKEMIGDADPMEVAMEWKQSGNYSNAPDVEDAITKFLDNKEFEGVQHDYIVHMSKALDRFREYFGKEKLNRINADAIRGWLEDLGFSPITQRNYRTYLTTFYNHFIDEGIIRNNPVSKVKIAEPVDEEVSVLSFRDTEKLFRANRNEPYIGRLALEAFAGLRFSTVQKLTYDDIKWDDQGIALPAAIMKTKKRQYIDGLPDNLWKWLKHTSKECWDLRPRQCRRMKSEAFIRAQVPHPRNVLRHSFCSYHVAANKDAARTAVILCHANPRMLYNHYKGVATEKDAKKYFNIVP